MQKMLFQLGLGLLNSPDRSFLNVRPGTPPSNSPRVSIRPGIRISGAVPVWETLGIALKRLYQNITRQLDGFRGHF
jgi:hypothetical protein